MAHSLVESFTRLRFEPIRSKTENKLSRLQVALSSMEMGDGRGINGFPNQQGMSIEGALAYKSRFLNKTYLKENTTSRVLRCARFLPSYFQSIKMPPPTGK